MKILLIEDSPQIREAITLALPEHDFVCADSLRAAYSLPWKPSYDAALLDLSIKDGTTEKLCHDLYEANVAQQIIYITAELSAEKATELLRLGADDYVRKPFSLEELRSRLLAHSRRSLPTRNLQIGNTKISVTQSRLMREDKELVLRPIEVKIALALAQAHPARVSETSLIDTVWGDEIFFSNTLNVHVTRLRRQLESQGSDITVNNRRGLGYRFVVRGEEEA